MPCVPLLRLALALDPGTDPAGHASAAEQGQFDLVTLDTPGFAVDVLAATRRPGVVAPDPAIDPERSGLLVPAGALHRASHALLATEVRHTSDVAPAGRLADLVFLSAPDPEQAAALVAAVRAAAGTRPVRIFADLDVRISPTPSTGPGGEQGTPATLAARLLAWRRIAGLDGLRLRPASAADVEALTREIPAALRENDAFRRGYEARGLRPLLGLPAVAPLSA